MSQRRSESCVQLGFLSSGAFFGEAAVVRDPHDGSATLRTRTVRAVTDTELCYLRKEDVHELYDIYPELDARMKRFAAACRALNDKTIKKLDITRDALKSYATEFKTQNALATKIRKENDLAADAYVSDCYATTHFKEATTAPVIAAVNRFKQLGNVARETQHDLPLEWSAAASVLGRRLARQEGKIDELGGKIDALATKFDRVVGLLENRALDRRQAVVD